MGSSAIDPIPEDVVAAVANASWITVFSGAGISAESGVPTFRDAETGIWANHDPAELATPEAWTADPALVWGWYQWRAHMVHEAVPNAGHRALADLDDGRTVLVVTQNVDDLHERAGSTVVSHLHGSLFAPRCSRCDRPYEGADADPDNAVERERVEPPSCQVCLSEVRPGVVWFGEALPADHWQRAENAFSGAEVVLVVGTSGVVYPAAGLPERAALDGVPVFEVNPAPSALSELASYRIAAPAAAGLPALVDAVRANRNT